MAHPHPVVSPEEWLAARRALLAKEKEFTRLRDELGRQRRELPWEEVVKPYAFTGPEGRETLAQLFEGRSQLVIYHFMFAPGARAGCAHCSFWADSFDPNVIHLAHHDVTLVAVSRAPYEQLAAYRRRMGWRFKWVSSADSDFNFDHQASFTPEQVASGRAMYNYTLQNPGGPDREGVSVFHQDGGRIFHTYSAYARGIDMLNAAYHYLDLTPKGRNEEGRVQFWVRRHDEYDR